MKRSFIISICLLFSILLLASCGSDNYSEAVGDASRTSPGNSAVPSPPGSDFSPSDIQSDESIVQFPILTPSQADGRKMIYTVTVYLQTTDFMQGARKLLDTVGNLDGYILSANVDGRDMRYPEVERRADYEFRVPTEQLTALR